MKTGWAVASLIVSAFAATCGAAEPPRRPPNFVVILIDDMGYGDIGPFGAKGYSTPNLDRMAREGMKFTDFYAAQGVCTSSRVGLLTGCYPNRLGLVGALPPKSRIGISDKEMTIAQMLKTQGYATAIYGKWHLGDATRFLPTRHGFDEYFGLPYSNDMWPEHPHRQANFPDLPLIDGEKAVKAKVTHEDQKMLTTWYTEHAVSFIERNKDRPFFLYMPHSMVHVPLHVSEKFAGKTERGLFGDVVEELDWSIGQVLDALKRTGVDDNTLVIFTSDNGPWLVFGDHAGSAGPLREGKATAWDGGVRVPCLMRWPGKVPAGAVSHEAVMTIDLLPTFARLAGAKPPDRPIDGKDIWPVIAGEAGAKSPHESLYIYWLNELHAVRSGRWSLHLPHPYVSMVGGTAGHGGAMGKTVPARTGLALFDLESDVAQSRDVSGEYPEVVDRLKAIAEAAREDLGDKLTNRAGKNVREPGRVVE